MIEIIQTPILNRVIADGNSTEIIIKSQLDGNYYFQANIYVDNELILPQSWSKDQTGTSRYNLKLLYYAYFKNDFIVPKAFGMEYKKGLFKKVRIEINEVSIINGQVSDRIVLPEFFIIKNRLPDRFSDLTPVQFLGLKLNEIEAPLDGVITFPLFIGSQEDLHVTIYDNNSNEVFTQTYIPRNTKVARYTVLLSQLSFAPNALFLVINFTVNSFSVSKRIRLIRESIYKPKQVFYQNNYGIYLSAYFKGKKEIDHKLKPKNYIQEDGNTLTFDIDDTLMLDINTGYSTTNILAHEVATSIDVRVFLEEFL